jgi:uncharacterized membrane protein YbhN (UPF0104 family)
LASIGLAAILLSVTTGETELPGGRPTVLARLRAGIGAVLFVLAIVVLVRAFRGHDVGAIWDELGALGAGRFAAAVALAAASWLVLLGYEALALRYAEARLPWWRSAWTGFVAQGIGRASGFATASGGALRLRLYSDAGLAPWQVGRVVLFVFASAWLGVLIVGGTLLVHGAPPLPAVIDGLSLPVRLCGAAMLVAGAGYLIAVIGAGRTVRMGRLKLVPPARRLALVQLGLSCLNPPIVAALVYVLLPSAAGLDYLTWLELFLLGQLVAMASHVPGGFGVLESGVVVLAGPHLTPPELAGALLVYRGLYTLLPLAAAVVALGAHEWSRRPGGTLRA